MSLRSLTPWALALAAGALWALPFAAEPLTLASWLALAPLCLVLGAAPSPARAAALGLTHGVAYWLAAVYWIAPTLSTYGGLGLPVGVALLTLLALYLGLYTAAFGAFGWRLWRRGGLAAWVGLPALWVTLEVLRGWVFTGFPWNLAAYAWTEQPGALPLSSWCGPWGVSFLVVWANVGVARAFAGGGWRCLATGLLVPLAVLAPALRWANAPGSSEMVEHAGSAVRLIQPNIQNQNPAAYDAESSWAGYQRLRDLSRAACDEPGALVVWPESAAWPFQWGTEPRGALQDDVASLNARGCPVLLNSTREEGERYFNSAYLVAGALTGEPEPARYDKHHLVPFGEYVPLQGVFGFMKRLARNAGDYSAADQAVLLPWGRQQIGLAICFEVIFPGDVARRVQDGATMLATITNDAWYGDTSAPWQHLRAARWRAAENRRSLVRAAITGVSAWVGSDGAVRGQLGVGESGYLPARVVGRVDLSPYTRWPRLVPWLCAVLAVAAWIWPNKNERDHARSRP